MSTSKSASICFIVCVIHFSFLSYLAKRQFPNVDEIAHLPAGISHWKFARFDLYEVSPPLIDLISSSSALLSSSEFDWTEYRVFRGARSEFTIGRTWLSNVKTKSSESFFFPRLLCGLLSVGGCACLTCIVANHLGYTTAMICCLLWCFSPSILAGGSTIIPDVGAMAIGVATCAAISDFCKRMSIETSLKAGVWLGLCLLSKLTWISFVLLVPLIVLFIRILVFHYRPAFNGMFILRVFTLLSVAVLVLNAGYFFENTMQPLGEFRFLSESFAGNERLVNEPVGNRFRGTWLSNVPIFVPANFIEGIDYLRMEVENKYWSFLDGEWRFGSWPYYYVLTTLYKTPEPTLIAAAMGVYIFMVGWWRGLMKPELVSMVLLLTIPAAVCFLSVSWQGGFNHHHRYVIMIYPPMFVFASLLASPMAEQVFSRKKLVAMVEDSHESEAANVSKALIPWWAVWRRYHWTKILAVVLVSLSVASSLRVHPYYTSY
ncbi:MAG: hypothetical protein ACK5N9_24150, partial [Pirellula sp.]